MISALVPAHNEAPHSPQGQVVKETPCPSAPSTTTITLSASATPAETPAPLSSSTSTHPSSSSPAATATPTPKAPFAPSPASGSTPNALGADADGRADTGAARAHTATHYPHALPVARRLVAAASLALIGVHIKEAA